MSNARIVQCRAVVYVQVGVWLSVFLWGGGCADRRGAIVVDRPEVFTRERLVNRRLKETEFIEGKLDQPYDPSVQGYHDTREFTAFLGQLSGQFDPLGGASSASEQAATIANAQRVEQLAQLQHRIDLADKQRALRDLLLPNRSAAAAADTVAGQSPAAGEGTTAPPAGNTGDPAGAKPQTPAADGQASPTLSDPDALAKHLAMFKPDNVPDPPSPADLVQTLAKPTMIESDRDELARRDFLQAMLRERELDDTHDLHGYTVYTLKFDVTVIPKGGNDEIGKVNITIEPHSSLPSNIARLADKSKFWPKDPGPPPRESDQDCTDRDRRPRRPCAKCPDFDAKLEQWKSETVDWDRWRELHTTYRSWRRAFQQTVQQEALALEQRHAANVLSVADRIQLAALATRSQDALAAHQKAVAAATEEDARRQLATLVQHRYETLTQRMRLQFSKTPVRMPKDRGKDEWYYLPVLDPPANENGVDGIEGNEEFREFALLVWELRGKQQSEPGHDSLIHRWQEVLRLSELSDPDDRRHGGGGGGGGGAFVYSVEPKEYAQNISEVAAAEKLHSFILSLRAALPQYGVDAGGYLNHVRDAQSRLQALLRRPLVVGYADGPRTLGWVIGPRFEIAQDRRRKVRFVHTHVQHSLQASVAVPAWERRLTLRGYYRWGDGPARPLWDGKRAGAAGWTAGGVLARLFGMREHGEVQIDLPSDPSALTEAFMAYVDGFEQRVPTIYPVREPDDQPQFVLRASTEPQTILIRGSELWRNPAVFIGSRKASRLEVLPDMSGLLATFERLEMPARVSGAIGGIAAAASGDAMERVDLRVVTSGGEAVLPAAVAVVPANGVQGPTTPLAVLQDAHVLRKGVLTFLVDPKTFPAGFDALRLRVRPAGAGRTAWAETSVEPELSPTRDRVTAPFEFGTVLPTWLNVSQEVSLELGVRPVRGQEFLNVPLRGRRSVVYFHEEKDGQLTASAAKVVFDDDQSPQPGTLKFRSNVKLDLLLKAYPGLGEAFSGAGREANLVLRRDDVEHVFPLTPGPKSALVLKADELRRADVNPQRGLIPVGQYTMFVRYAPSPTPVVPVSGSLTVEKNPDRVPSMDQP